MIISSCFILWTILASSPVFLAVSLVLFFWILKILVHRRKWAKVIDEIPGPSAWPILGNVSISPLSPQDIFRQGIGEFLFYGKKSNGIVREWIGIIPFIFLTKAEAVEVILSSFIHIDKSFNYQYLEPWLGSGLVTSTGKKWHTHRKLLTPAFHFSILENFLSVMNEQCQTLIKRLDAKAGGGRFDIFSYINLCALDIICVSAMGCSINAQKQGDSDYVKAVNSLSAVTEIRTNRPWLAINFIYYFSECYKKEQKDLAIVKGFTKKVIEDRKKTIEGNISKTSEGKKSRLAFLDLILSTRTAEGKPLADDEIQEEVDTFMFGGHDTTTSGISWCLYLLGHYPQIQNKCYDELKEIFGDSDCSATSEDVRKMKYLECCLKEAQRLYPSVPIIGRTIKKETDIVGYKIPAGTTIMISTYALHHDPDVWSDVEQFNPDRFLSHNLHGLNPYAYIPFSAGPRNCLGQKFAMMEEKVVVSSVLRHYKVQSCDQRDTIQLIGQLILRPLEGFNVILTKRSSAS